MSIRTDLDGRLGNIHTIGMKIAVSIPDSIFAEAEGLAKRLRLPRSKLYARALGEFVANHEPDRVTELANKAADELVDEAQSLLRAGARTVLKHTDW
jgi:hypothetical protein